MITIVFHGTGVDEDSLSRLLKAAYQNGFFRIRGTTNRIEVRHNRLSEALVADKPGTMRPIVIAFFLF